MNALGQILRCSPRRCQTDMGAGRECGKPAVATVGGTDVCAVHEESVRAAAETALRVIRRQS